MKFIHTWCAGKMISIYHLDYAIVKNFALQRERSKIQGRFEQEYKIKGRHWKKPQWTVLKRFKHIHKSEKWKNANDSWRQTPICGLLVNHSIRWFYLLENWSRIIINLNGMSEYTLQISEVYTKAGMKCYVLYG